MLKCFVLVGIFRKVLAQCRACGEIFPPTSRLGVLFLSGGVAPFPRAGRRSSSLSFATSPGSGSPQEPQEPYDPWTVLLYLRDNPAVHAQLSSRDIEGQLAEIAGVLSLPRHEIVHTYRANVALPDLSAPYAADYPSHR